MRIVFLGPPGAGKGTQAVLLAERMGFGHIATGDILRDNVKKKTAIGKKAQSFMEKGDLVPDDIVIQMMLDKISAFDKDKGFILDGFPRTLYQAHKLDKELGKLNLPIDMAVYFKTSCFIFNTICGTSSNMPGIVENSCRTPSILTDVTAVPSIEDINIRRNEFAMVVPNPRSKGSAINLP